MADTDGKVSILLVDDDADCRLLIRDAIAECKVSNDVHEVCNGREALDFLHKRGKYANAPRPRTGNCWTSLQLSEHVSPRYLCRARGNFLLPRAQPS